MKIILKFYKLFISDSLYKNSIYLMLSTGVMSLLGFLFWIITTRVYTVEQVGIGTTLISTMSLISGFSILGLENGLIRYLPKSDRKNIKINTSFTLVALMSILISVIYLIFQKTFSPKLLFVRESILFSMLFILFTVFSSLNIISENVFIAYRSSRFVLIKNTIYSIVKIILTIFLVTFGAYGIFMSSGIAIIFTVLISLTLLILLFKYLPRPTLDIGIIKNMTRFSLGNYTAGLIGGLPLIALPILITNMIGAESSAYFYMDMMIASFIYVIPEATSTAFFAEGSNSETEIKIHLKKALKIISIIIVPVIIITFIFGKYILLVFGEKYSDEGFILLRFLSVSGLFISVNAVGNAILYIKQKIRLLIFLNLLSTSLIFLLSVIFIKVYPLGILGIGISWIFGQGVGALIYLFLLRKII